MKTGRPDRNPVLIVGCGDIGCRVAALELAAGNPVAALARSEETAGRLARQGLRVARGDLDAPASLTRPGTVFPFFRTLYYFAPPPATGMDDPRLRALLAALQAVARPECVIYLSTSGVYGDCRGEWVDEDRPPNPQTDRARRRLDAELRLRDWCGRQGMRDTVLRVPGIYGPGRLPLERLRRGVPVLREAESPYSNRIHADDLAAACFAAARLGRPGRVYNASDGHPTTMTDYFQRVADLYGLPRPPVLSLTEARRVLGPGVLSFLEESRRLDNRRMLEELRVELRYPDLASGLAACRAADSGARVA